MVYKRQYVLRDCLENIVLVPIFARLCREKSYSSDIPRKEKDSTRASYQNIFNNEYCDEHRYESSKPRDNEYEGFLVLVKVLDDDNE